MPATTLQAACAEFFAAYTAYSGVRLQQTVPGFARWDEWRDHERFAGKSPSQVRKEWHTFVQQVSDEIRRLPPEKAPPGSILRHRSRDPEREAKKRDPELHAAAAAAATGSDRDNQRALLSRGWRLAKAAEILANFGVPLGVDCRDLFLLQASLSMSPVDPEQWPDAKLLEGAWLVAKQLKALGESCDEQPRSPVVTGAGVASAPPAATHTPARSEPARRSRTIEAYRQCPDCWATKQGVGRAYKTERNVRYYKCGTCGRKWSYQIPRTG